MTYIATLSVKPHADDTLPWTVLWVLRAGKDHVLLVADHIPKNIYSGIFRLPSKKERAGIPVRIGSMILFNCHNLHWLTRSSDGEPFVALCHDFAQKPTREQVEAWFLNETAAPDAPARGTR